IVVARGPDSGIETGRCRRLRTDSAAMACRPGSFPWYYEVEKQHARERDNKRSADYRRGSCVQGIREGIFEDVDASTEERPHDECSEAPKCARTPGANDHGLRRT